MVKATKLTLAAALLAASCSLAIAQGTGVGTEGPKGSDANPPPAAKQQPGEAKTAPAQGAQAPAAKGKKQVQNPTAPAAQGTETGSARDTAGPGGERKLPGSGAADAKGKPMTTQPTGMTDPNNSTGNMNTKGTGKGTTGTGNKGGSGNQ